MQGPADGGTHHPSASLHQQTSLSNDGCAVPVRAVELRIHGASGLSGASGRVIAVVRAQTRPQAGPTLLARIGSTIGHGGGRHASTRSGTTDGGCGEGAAMFEELAESGEAALQHGRVVLGAWARIPTDATCLEISVRLLRSACSSLSWLSTMYTSKAESKGPYPQYIRLGETGNCCPRSGRAGRQGESGTLRVAGAAAAADAGHCPTGPVTGDPCRWHPQVRTKSARPFLAGDGA